MKKKKKCLLHAQLTLAGKNDLKIFKLAFRLKFIFKARYGKPKHNKNLNDKYKY